MEPARVRKLADGRIYTGRQAQKLGLVDEMGTMEDAVNAAARLAGISGKPNIRDYGNTGLWETIFGSEGRSLFDVLLSRVLRGSSQETLWLNPGPSPQFR